MICTFGDVTDVTWWRELGLPVRAIILPDGRLRAVAWGNGGWESTDDPAAQAAYDQLAGLTAVKARAKIVELLGASGDLVGEPRPITHPVKFYEKGDRPLEIVTSRQWFVKTIEARQPLIERGRELAWHPPFMRARYENWVEGLNGDWCVSRQRFFGVPFPIWYPIGPDGGIRYDQRIVAREDQLPIDPSTDVPPGYTADAAGPAERLHGRSRRDGHMGDLVADTADRGRMGRRSGPLRAHVPDGLAAAGARNHPDLAVLHGGACALRARRAAVDEHDDRGLGARSRSQEDVEVQGQRRHSDGAARRAWLGRRPVLGGERPSRHRHGVRRRADARRPAARDQAAQRIEVRPGEVGTARAGDRAARSRNARPVWRLLVATAPNSSTATTTRRCSSAPSDGSGRSATTTSSS